MSGIALKWRAEPGKSYAGLEEKIAQGAADGLNAIGLITTNYMKSSLQKGPKSGLIYRLSNPTRVHQASAPGEFPATDRGELVRSIGFDTADPKDFAAGMGIGVVMFASAPHAIPLELKPSSRGGRPFMSRAVNDKKEDYGKILQSSINARLK